MSACGHKLTFTAEMRLDPNFDLRAIGKVTNWARCLTLLVSTGRG